MSRTLRFAMAAGAMTLLLCGCDALEPYDRANTWRPTGANDANLAAMAVNPADLIHGRGTTPSDGPAATAPIERLRHDHVKTLQDDNSTSNSTPSPAAGLTGN
jgi:type IV pilus biogenesis protein CpaD/CtpE